MLKTADVVIVGGGCMGASTAYHLAERGAERILLLEREQFLGMGSTGRNAGGVRYQFSTDVNIQLSLYSVNIIANFEELFGISASYKPIGYLFLLSSEVEVAIFRANIERQRRLGVRDVRFLEVSDIERMVPLVNLEGVVGGSFCPHDGLADPNSVTQGFASAARRLGAEIETEVTVTGIRVEGGCVTAVETDRGVVATPAVVNCAGPWASKIGRMAGVDVPIVPLRRQFFMTGPLPQVDRHHPFTIDFATTFYFHPEGAGVLAGMANQEEKPAETYAIDEEFHHKTLEQAVKRLPLLEHAHIIKQMAGLYEVTPDAHPILAHSRDVRGFYVAAGFSGHGFQHSPAAGKVMSEIILDGHAHTVDVSMLDLERFRENRLVQELNVI